MVPQGANSLHTGKKKRWQHLIIVLTAMIVVVIANRRLKIEATDTPGAAGYAAPKVSAQAAADSAPQVSAQAAADIALPEQKTPEKAVTGETVVESGKTQQILGAGRESIVETLVHEEELMIDFDAPYPYYIYVNRAANTVTVYGIDRDGAYTIPYKAFVCSASESTVLGTFTTTRGHEWGSLIGGVYAQYSTRITGPFLFHSVPYYRYGDPSSLETEEYNKLGTLASAGCIRLSVEDAKWIFDNCPPGTTVRIYDDADDPGRLGKPEPLTIDPDDARSGWDPTDPDPRNPWHTSSDDALYDD